VAYSASSNQEVLETIYLQLRLSETLLILSLFNAFLGLQTVSISIIAAFFAKYLAESFQNFAPRLYSYCRANVREILASNPTLQENISQGAWSALTVNFGPQIATIVHTDGLNLSFRWCCITALGNFDA
jgi:hypothetical protein